jgi:WD40 repeat protein
MIIGVWSKDGQLLISFKKHENIVMSLCWSKDGARIFSASCDGTIRQWRLIDGEELVVLRGHAKAITSLCLSPNERHLVSASHDCSVCIWDLKTNKQAGDPFLHDDELMVVVMSPDGKYIASAGLDAKIYVWSVEAALKQQDVRICIAFRRLYIFSRFWLLFRVRVMLVQNPTRSLRQVSPAVLSYLISPFY